MNHRTALVAIGFVGLLVLGGCVGGQKLDEEQEREVVDRIESRMSSLDSYHATMTTDIDMGQFGNSSETVTAEVWARPNSGELRQHVLAPENQAGDLVVSNESTTVTYDASANSYRTLAFGGLGGTANMTTGLDDMIERYDIVLDGTETVAGHETYAVTLVPESNQTIQFETRMWIDVEKKFPRRVETSFGDVTSTVTYENLTINPDLDDDRFTFDPPANATKSEGFGGNIETVESREGLVEQADVGVPDPKVPSGFAFESGSVTAIGSGETVTMQFANETASMTITSQPAVDDSIDAGGDDTVSIDGRTASVTSTSMFTSVSWECSDRSYQVMGQLSEQSLTTTARSIGCS